MAAPLPKLLEVRRGRLRIRQRPLPLARHPAAVADLARFFAVPAAPPANDADFDRLVALLVQESPLALPALIKASAVLLVPPPLVSTPSSSSSVAASTRSAAVESWLESVIPRIAHRVNYGYTPSDGPAPENLSLWRWEVLDPNLFPDDVRTAVLERHTSRESACAEFALLIAGLTPEARAQLLGTPISASASATTATPTDIVSSSPTSPKPVIILPKSSSSSSIVPSTSDLNSPSISPNAKAAAIAAEPLSQPSSAITNFSSPIRPSFPLSKTALSPFGLQPAKRKADTDVLLSAVKEAKHREKLLKEEEKAQDRQRKEEERTLKRIEKEKKDAERKLSLKAEKEAKEAERKAAKEAKEAKEAEEHERQKRKEIAGQKTLTGFFFTVQKETKDVKEEIEDVAVAPPEFAAYAAFFRPFHVREHVSLAPINPLWRAASVDDALRPTDASVCKSDFLAFAKDNNRQWRRAIPRIPPSMLAMNTPTANTPPMRSWKLLQFAENVRPAYFGTWSKTSDSVNGRRPFAKDETRLDYEFDSEAEWEEDEPGEELKSEDEDDDEEAGTGVGTDDDDDEEDKWMVPHGYLSDDEGVDEDMLSTQNCKSVPSARQGKPDEAGQHRSTPGDPLGKSDTEPTKRKPLEQLVPVLVGPFFGALGDAVPSMMDALKPLLVEPIGDFTTNIDPFEVPEDQTPSVTKTPRGVQKSAFPDTYIPALITAITQSDARLHKLVDDFKARFPVITKRAIEAKIREIAVRKRGVHDSRARWHVVSGVVEPVVGLTPSVCIPMDQS